MKQKKMNQLQRKRKHTNKTEQKSDQTGKISVRKKLNLNISSISSLAPLLKYQCTLIAWRLTVAHLANQIVYRKTTTHTHTHTCEARMFVHWSECVPLPVCTFNPYEYGEWAEFIYYNTWYVWWCTLNLVKSHFVCTFWLHTVFINVMHKHLMFDVKVPPSLRVKAIAHWQWCLHEFKVCLFFLSSASSLVLFHSFRIHSFKYVRLYCLVLSLRKLCYSTTRLQSSQRKRTRERGRVWEISCSASPYLVVVYRNTTVCDLFNFKRE